MQIKKLSLSVIPGLFLAVVMTGCDHGHNHDNEHSHDSVGQEAEKMNNEKSKNHNTID